MKIRAMILAVLGLGACGTPLVGGECAPGYEANAGACVPAHDPSTTGSSASSASVSASASSSSGSGGSACPDGLPSCDAACVDLATSADHCGDCATACAAGTTCVAGICEPPGPVVTGQAVLIGMSFEAVAPGDPMAMLLGNAVFASKHSPVRILDYRELAQWNATTVTNTVDLIADEAVARGRQVQTVVAPSGAMVPALLSSHAYDVLFVHDLDAAPAGALAQLGESWAGSLDEFTSTGGVVVVVATTGGTGEMPDFIAGTGLFLTMSAESAAGQNLSVMSGDALSAGLGASLTAAPGAASFSLGGAIPMVDAVVATPALAPVVLHRVWYAR